MATEYETVPGGVRLAWDEAGDGPAVLLVHGIGYTRKKWEPQVQPLVQAGYRVVRFDLRGFGQSTAPDRPIGMADYVEDLARFVEARDLGAFHLVGHSLGGMIAQKLAVRGNTPLASLTLACTTSHNGRRATAFARLMVTFAEHGFETVMRSPNLRAQAEAVLHEAFPAGVELEMLRRGMEEPSAARANAWRACIEFSVKDDLERIACPVLVVHGSADRLIPHRAGQLVHEAIPGSEWLGVDGGGHALPKHHAEVFNERLVAFLRRVDAR